jgi:tellurite resistance protein
VRSLQAMPVGWFGLAMGIAGLALALRLAGRVLSVPPALGEIVALVAVAVEAGLLAAYLLKYLKYRDAVRAEFENVATLGFTGTIPISLFLTAACLAPWTEMLAEAVWWLAAGVFLVFYVYALRRWIAGGHEAAVINPGWMIVVLGGLLSPIGGTQLGLLTASTILFSISLGIAPFVIGLTAWRAVTGPAPPDAMKPALFIFLVPPSLIFSSYPMLWGERPLWLLACLYFPLMLAVALLIASRRFLSWPFGTPWAAFTFPFAALAGAAIRHAAANPALLTKTIAWITLALAAFFVALVSGRALAALARGKLSA